MKHKRKLHFFAELLLFLLRYRGRFIFVVAGFHFWAKITVYVHKIILACFYVKHIQEVISTQIMGKVAQKVQALQKN